ncbi:MAG: TRAP transporter small permease subunit [Gammaproteobacteria bacterium]|nr:TRAP transporter small permease subunit [Gammaproteobacteria bacterium]MDH3447312.1 TRAP transporter small permease subunit [Gammaproteobacteria bacterium]
MNRFDAARSLFERLLEAITVLLIISLAVVVVLGVIFRWAGEALSWYDEIASVQLAWLTYYGASLAALKRAHIGVPGVISRVPPRLRVPLVFLAEAVIIGFFLMLAWYGYVVLVILEGDTLISLPWIGTRFTQSVIPIGAILFVIAEILNLPQIWREATGRAAYVRHE